MTQELITRDDFELPPEQKEHKWKSIYEKIKYETIYHMSMRKDGSGWDEDNTTIESNEPMNDKPYKEIGCEPECKACPHGKLTYYTNKYGQYKSILCMAAKHPDCVGGFLQKDDVYI